MISFKANYIDSTKIKRINTSGISDKKVSFVEVNPSDFNDQISINQAAIMWDKNGGDGFAYDICESFNKFFEPNFPKHNDRFFAITTQNDELETLNPQKILALTQVIEFDKHTQYITYLQVDPKNSSKNRKAEYHGVGRAMLDSLKQLFNNKDIVLDSVKNAVKFYLKNGFIVIGKNQCDEKRMIFKCASKSLH